MDGSVNSGQYFPEFRKKKNMPENKLNTDCSQPMLTFIFDILTLTNKINYLHLIKQQKYQQTNNNNNNKAKTCKRINAFFPAVNQ